MAYRTFADEHGKRWEVWDVRPDVERRNDDRRADWPELWAGLEHRDPLDRRQLAEARVRLARALAAGWLMFTSENEKRRLAPLPPGWESLRDEELRALCSEAHVVAGRMDDRGSA